MLTVKTPWLKYRSSAFERIFDDFEKEFEMTENFISII